MANAININLTAINVTQTHVIKERERECQKKVSRKEFWKCQFTVIHHIYSSKQIFTLAF